MLTSCKSYEPCYDYIISSKEEPIQNLFVPKVTFLLKKHFTLRMHGQGKIALAYLYNI